MLTAAAGRALAALDFTLARRLAAAAVHVGDGLDAECVAATAHMLCGEAQQAEAVLARLDRQQLPDLASATTWASGAPTVFDVEFSYPGWGMISQLARWPCESIPQFHCWTKQPTAWIRSCHCSWIGIEIGRRGLGCKPLPSQGGMLVLVGDSSVGKTRLL